MKFPRIELDAKRFYVIGKYSFFIVGVIGLIRVVDLWNSLKSYDIFSSLASTVFTFALFMYFAYLQEQEDNKVVNDEDIFKMNDALNKLQLGGNTNAKTR